jgi:hypothetical protein
MVVSSKEQAASTAADMAVRDTVSRLSAEFEFTTADILLRILAACLTRMDNMNDNVFSQCEEEESETIGE